MIHRTAPATLGALAAVALGLACLIACSASGPEPIRYGEDGCAYCRMTIVDRNFGTEFKTARGKVFKFDSIECLAAYLAVEDGGAAGGSAWVTNHAVPETFIAASEAVYVHTDSLRSPMGLGLFAFRTETEARAFGADHAGRILTWPETCTLVAAAWVQGR